MIDVKALMTEDGYRSGLRSPVRGLWTGVITYDQFWETMMTVVRLGFTAAWYAGAEECGIQPGELTDEEQAELEQAISREYDFIDGFATSIEKGNRDAGGKLETHFRRLDLWVKRYRDVRNRAKVMACADQKLMWKINPEKENCCSCLRLAGKVKRGSYWKRVGVRPQHPTLHCVASAGGVSVCGCELVVTNERCAPGPLPNWIC